MSDFKIGAMDSLQTAALSAQMGRSQATLEKARNLAEAAEGRGENPKMTALKEKRTEEAAADFESLLVKQMLSSMWKSVPQSGFLDGGGREQEIFRDMLNDEVAKQISRTQSIGIKDDVLKDMQKGK